MKEQTKEQKDFFESLCEEKRHILLAIAGSPEALSNIIADMYSNIIDDMYSDDTVRVLTSSYIGVDLSLCGLFPSKTAVFEAVTNNLTDQEKTEVYTEIAEAIKAEDVDMSELDADLLNALPPECFEGIGVE